MTPLTEAQMADCLKLWPAVTWKTPFDLFIEGYAAGLAANQREVERFRSELNALDKALRCEGWSIEQRVEHAGMLAHLAAKFPAQSAPEQPSIQACRPEDRAMLQTPVGAEMVRLAAAALNEPPIPARGADRDFIHELWVKAITIANEETLGRTAPVVFFALCKEHFQAQATQKPVATVMVGPHDHGPLHYETTLHGLDVLTDGRHSLYTAPLADRAVPKGFVVVNILDLEHIQEYWNGSCNERAMSNALDHINQCVSAMLAASPTPPAAPTGENSARLRWAYNKAMGALINPHMSFEHWISAIDEELAAAQRAKEGG